LGFVNETVTWLSFCNVKNRTILSFSSRDDDGIGWGLFVLNTDSFKLFRVPMKSYNMRSLILNDEFMILSGNSYCAKLKMSDLKFEWEQTNFDEKTKYNGIANPVIVSSNIYLLDHLYRGFVSIDLTSGAITKSRFQ